MTEPAYDIVIRGGRVATACDVFEADVAIAGETIAAIGRGLPAGKGQWDAGCLSQNRLAPGSKDWRARGHPDRNPLTPNLRRPGIIVGEWSAIGRTKGWRAIRGLPSRFQSSSPGVNWVGSSRTAMPSSSIERAAMSD